MLKLRYLLLGLMAALAVSATASATASAVTCPNTPGLPTLCFLNGTVLESAAVGIHMFTNKKEAGTTALFEVPAIGLHIVCTEANSTGEFNQGVVLTAPVTVKKVEVDFTMCTVELPLEGTTPKCKVKNDLILAKAEGAFLETEVGGVLTELELKPIAPSTVFAVVEIENNTGQTCPPTIVGSHNVGGSVEFEIHEASNDKAIPRRGAIPT
jgi:hypothetical protein